MVGWLTMPDGKMTVQQLFEVMDIKSEKDRKKSAYLLEYVHKIEKLSAKQGVVADWQIYKCGSYISSVFKFFPKAGGLVAIDSVGNFNGAAHKLLESVYEGVSMTFFKVNNGWLKKAFDVGHDDESDDDDEDDEDDDDEDEE